MPAVVRPGELQGAGLTSAGLQQCPAVGVVGELQLRDRRAVRERRGSPDHRADRDEPGHDDGRHGSSGPVPTPLRPGPGPHLLERRLADRVGNRVGRVRVEVGPVDPAGRPPAAKRPVEQGPAAVPLLGQGQCRLP